MPADPHEAVIEALDEILQRKLSMALDFELLTEIADAVIEALEQFKSPPAP